VFAFRIDEQKKLVHVKIAGLQSVEEADKLTEELVANASAARRKFGYFRLLADARESPVQPAATMARYKSPQELLETDKDRYAVVLGSMLSKLQTDRMLVDERMRAFLSLETAESWLSGDQPSEARRG
jgi:hypothetical protein